jgi:hypothetical protein
MDYSISPRYRGINYDFTIIPFLAESVLQRLPGVVVERHFGNSVVETLTRPELVY